MPRIAVGLITVLSTMLVKGILGVIIEHQKFISNQHAAEFKDLGDNSR